MASWCGKLCASAHSPPSPSRLGRSRCSVLLSARGLDYGTLQAPTADKAASTRPISFDTDIRPILAENCFACHGPDETKRKAKLHFDTREGAYSRPNVIVPGNTAKSLLIQHITSESGRAHAASGLGACAHAASDRAAHAMDRRGRQVGPAFSIQSPNAPRAAAIRRRQSVRNPIDRFVLYRLSRRACSRRRKPTRRRCCGASRTI